MMVGCLVMIQNGHLDTQSGKTIEDSVEVFNVHNGDILKMILYKNTAVYGGVNLMCG